MEAGKEEREIRKGATMSIRISIIVFTIILTISGCSNTRFLTEDQVLYTGREKLEINHSGQDSKQSMVKPMVNAITDYKVNNSLFGRRILPPVGLWVFNYMNPDENRKVGRWVRKTLSASPVLISEVNPDLRAQKIENDLFDLGYFNTTAWSVVDTSSRNAKKARISYFVEVGAPFVYDQIVFDTLKEKIDTLIGQHNYGNLIKRGTRYDLGNLKTARSELSRAIQNQGYYFFTPDIIKFTADTSWHNNTLNLAIGRDRDLPANLLSTYTIDDVVIFIGQPSDQSGVIPDTTWLDGISLISEGNFLKSNVVVGAVDFNKGDTYSYAAYQNTLSRLNNLGVFDYVRVSFSQSENDSLLGLIDVRVELSMSDPITMDFEADLVSKSTGYTGPDMMVAVSHNNTFSGGEKFRVGLEGGFEWQWGNKSKSQLGTFSYDVGLKTGITLPKIVLPVYGNRNRPFKAQQTSVNFDFNLLNRTAYYKMFSSVANLNYSWARKREIKHSFSPVYFNSVSLLNTTPAFDSVVDENIYIRKSFEEQFILGTRYEFVFDNTWNQKRGNVYYMAGVNSSGNALDLFVGIGKDPSERPYLFLNNIYSQFVKITSDFRYYLNGINKSLVFRLYTGVGMPYGNSTVLPYVEQFFSGGAYSIRGFTARYLGPGSYHEENSGYIDQSGDMKLEGNLEYRFGITKILKGAVFVETGNIWLINEDEYRPGAKFDVRTFINQLAVGGGVGLRFDFSFFVLRTDLGVPLRTPYVRDDRNWRIGTGSIFSETMFYLAIGYPF